MKRFYNLRLLLSAVMCFGVAGLVNAQVTTFNFTGTIETYTVPAGVTMIEIETNGAQGGDGSFATGGLGAQMIGEFVVTPGQILEIMVGESPATTNGGGGGTFVVDQATGDPIIVAGGGGGGSGTCCGVPHEGSPGQITEAGSDGVNASGGTGAGGTGGNGGGLGTQTQNAGAGGGFYTDGADGFSSTHGGKAYVNGGAGGVNYGGGYGGGGGSYCAGNGCAGGGGGGYSGGGSTGGGSQWGGGGGGGSYNTGTAQVNTSGVVSGNGSVVITELCNGLVTTVSSDSICDGETVILHAESTGAGTITWSGGITDSVAFTPSVGTTTYTATSDDINDCEFSIDIVVFDLPTVDAGMDVDFCTGDSVILGASGTATDWSWDGGIMDSVAFAAPTGPTTYTVTGTIDSTGCMAMDSVVVTEVIIDNTVSALGTDLMANQAGATYQWIDCSDMSDIAGETSQTYADVPEGDFAVVITLDGCMDTSACQLVTVGIDELDAAVTVYPNPTSGEVTITASNAFDYQVIDLLGKTILTGKGVSQETIDLTDVKSGTYFIKVNSGDLSKTMKLIKK